MRRTLGLAGGLVLGIILSQFPEYAQQYTQRLGGAVDELRVITEDFDRDAAEWRAQPRGGARAAIPRPRTASSRDRGASMQSVFARYRDLGADARRGAGRRRDGSGCGCCRAISTATSGPHARQLPAGGAGHRSRALSMPARGSSSAISCYRRWCGCSCCRSGGGAGWPQGLVTALEAGPGTATRHKDFFISAVDPGSRLPRITPRKSRQSRGVTSMATTND